MPTTQVIRATLRHLHGASHFMVLAAVIFPTLAFAFAGGTVSGSLSFYNHQGNYCGATQDCTGARYLQAQHDVYMPVADTKVYVLRSSDGALIGQGTSDAYGNFAVSWFDLNNFGGATQAVIQWRAEHKDGRFSIRDAAGSTIYFSTGLSPLSLWPNQTTNIGNWGWGSPGLPSAFANLYDGARRSWAVALAQSNRMNSYFSNVEVHALSTACISSSSNCDYNSICMDVDSAYRPQTRILHEMGHIASCRASRDQTYIQEYYYYDYPNTTTGGTWNAFTAEWSHITFEEALASFIADVALYDSTATTPYTCYNDQNCQSGISLEESLALTTGCMTDDNRREINHERYFWDIYDTQRDSCRYPCSEALNRGIWEVLDTINSFDNGYDNRQKNEVFNTYYIPPSWYYYVDDLEGRSAIDFRENWNLWGTNSSSQLSINCGAVGD